MPTFTDLRQQPVDGRQAVVAGQWPSRFVQNDGGRSRRLSTNKRAHRQPQGRAMSSVAEVLVDAYRRIPLRRCLAIYAVVCGLNRLFCRLTARMSEGESRRHARPALPLKTDANETGYLNRQSTHAG